MQLVGAEKSQDGRKRGAKRWRKNRGLLLSRGRDPPRQLTGKPQNPKAGVEPAVSWLSALRVANYTTWGTTKAETLPMKRGSRTRPPKRVEGTCCMTSAFCVGSRVVGPYPRIKAARLTDLPLPANDPASLHAGITPMPRSERISRCPLSVMAEAFSDLRSELRVELPAIAPALSQ